MKKYSTTNIPQTIISLAQRESDTCPPSPHTHFHTPPNTPNPPLPPPPTHSHTQGVCHCVWGEGGKYLEGGHSALCVWGEGECKMRCVSFSYALKVIFRRSVGGELHFFLLYLHFRLYFRGICILVATYTASSSGLKYYQMAGVSRSEWVFRGLTPF